MLISIQQVETKVDIAVYSSNDLARKTNTFVIHSYLGTPVMSGTCAPNVKPFVSEPGSHRRSVPQTPGMENPFSYGAISTNHCSFFDIVHSLSGNKLEPK
jgi:hypothetical protein